MTLVSAIMPTTLRRAAWIPRALRCWDAQTHDDRELIVVGPPQVAELLPNDVRVRFVEATGVRLGAKRNLACAHARGTYLAHWDDDDWYAPWRLEEQLVGLQAADKQVSGVRTMPFLDLHTGELWQYTYPNDLIGVVGATLFYARDLWRTCPFATVDSGEDVLWCNAHRRQPALASRVICIASSHSTNTSRRRYVPPQWRRLSQVDHAALPIEATDWIASSRGL